MIDTGGHNLALKIETGAHGDGNGFAYPPGVHDDSVKAGEHVTLYTFPSCIRSKAAARKS